MYDVIINYDDENIKQIVNLYNAEESERQFIDNVSGYLQDSQFPDVNFAADFFSCLRWLDTYLFEKNEPVHRKERMIRKPDIIMKASLQRY